MANPINNLKDVLKQKIDEQMNSLKTFEIGVVTATNYTEQTYNVKVLNKNKQYNDVPLCGQFLGNLRGIVGTYKENDLIILMFIKEMTKPYIAGSIFDRGLTPSFDNIVPLQENEMFIGSKENGGFIHFSNDGKVHIRNSADVPIGSIQMFHASFTNTPSLPAEWHICDGSTISDSDSPYNGQSSPNLNGKLIKGSSTTGTSADIEANTSTPSVIASTVTMQYIIKIK